MDKSSGGSQHQTARSLPSRSSPQMFVEAMVILFMWGRASFQAWCRLRLPWGSRVTSKLRSRSRKVPVRLIQTMFWYYPLPDDGAERLREILSDLQTRDLWTMAERLALMEPHGTMELLEYTPSTPSPSQIQIKMVVTSLNHLDCKRIEKNLFIPLFPHGECYDWPWSQVAQRSCQEHTWPYRNLGTRTWHPE